MVLFINRLVTVTVVALATLVAGTAIAVNVRPRPHASSSHAARPVSAPTSLRKIDEYGNIKFSDEKPRLENMAIELRNDPNAKGYLIGYAGRRARVGEARRRIERAKRYLTNSLKIAPGRIETIDGGHRENLTVELWVFPADSQPPYVSPTVDPSEVTIIKTRPKRRTRPR